MKFFFPDSHDLVDPSFDFRSERRTYAGSRQQAQLYAHEVLDLPPYDGMLVSKAAIDGKKNNVRYSFAQIQRLKRLGVREFLRLDRTAFAKRIETMGDCGSFTYVNESEPPFTVSDVIEFYLDCKFDYGLSLDHVILGYSNDDAKVAADELEKWKRRFEMTVELADQFLQLHRRNRMTFGPIGVAQGWSPESYSKAVVALQKMGYEYIALGGMVPMRTHEIVACLEAVRQVRLPEIRLHLLGIGRFDRLGELDKYGICSFDSTAPLKQAFMDDRDNYYTASRTYTAIRIPQVGENANLKKRILSGEIDQGRARQLEKDCFVGAMAFAEGSIGLATLVARLREYEELWHGGKDNSERYRQTLQDAPWRHCKCSICRNLGIHVVIFRGAERNRRRGFHNMQVVRNRLCQSDAFGY
jgi:queuine tRNA-ribosyltransferase-like protein